MIIPVILSGGTGTRLWPVSRETHSKPFIRLSDGESLLLKTRKRVNHLQAVPEVLTITNREYYFKTKDEYAILGDTLGNNCFLLEPVGRNTAAAIAMAAWYILDKYGADNILLVLPADHLIEQQEIFDRVVKQAYEMAKENKLITFGIKPTSPETGFGYIKLADTSQNQYVCKVEKFIEKPSLQSAEQYCASELYLWNSGMFCFKADTILAQLETFAPAIFAAASACWKASKKKDFQSDKIEMDTQTFQKIPDLSIDYAVMEKAQDIFVVPCDFNWTDIGSWLAVSKLVAPDDLGNRTVGETLLIDSTNSFIQSNQRLIATLGIKNLIIIDTPDALLVADSDRSQDVKKIVDQLKLKNHVSYKNHLTVFRPWGSYTTLEEGERFKIKRIVVKPRESLSLQMHFHRSEHWVVVSGVAKVTKDAESLILNINESTFVPAGSQHRLENPGLVDLVLIEIQTGEYLAEDDIVRFDDKYGRENSQNNTTDTIEL